MGILGITIRILGVIVFADSSALRPTPAFATRLIDQHGASWATLDASDTLTFERAAKLIGRDALCTEFNQPTN